MSTDTSVTELVINKLTKTQFEGIQNPSDTELYVVTDASYSYNDLSDKPDNMVTTDTDQDITGVKTFVGEKRIKLEQSQSSDKMGLTIFDDNELEAGAIEFRPNTINNYPLLYMGQYKNSDATPAQYISTPVYVGFRNYEKDTANSITAAYNLVAPLARDAKTPFNLTAAYQNFYLPLGVTDGATTVTTASTGLLNISTLIPSDYVHTSGNETIGGNKTFSAQTHFASGQGIRFNTSSNNEHYVMRSSGSPALGCSLLLNNNPTTSAFNVSSTNITIGSNTILPNSITPATSDNSTRIATTAYVKNQGYAADSDVVKLSGNQTIGGTKTFSESPIIERSGAAIYLDNSNITRGTPPSSGELNDFVAFRDKNGNNLGSVKFAYKSNGSTIMQFITNRHDGSSGSPTLSLYCTSSNTGYTESPEHRPNGDNSRNLGTSSYRWKQLYAGTTTISTSDERLKQQIEEVPEAVLNAWGEVKFYQYKFKDAVKEKGENARFHTGMIAQRIKDTFIANNLDAFDYGLLCYDELEGDGELQDRYSLRYEECLCMEAAYQRHRADKLEERLANLEANINKLMGF